MLHSSTLHYYACYCALICLLCQQHYQQTNAVTIIIDGASSNEWATRDEYQRLADDSASGNGDSSQQELAGAAAGGVVPGDGGGALTGGRFAPANVADLADLLATSGATQRRLVATDETGNSFRGQQQQQQQQQREQLKPAEELDLALDRLDLIERERQAEVARLRQLQALERDAESGAARALSHQAQATGAQINVAEIPPDAYVAMAKANRRRKQRDVPKRRCGEDLTKALEFVCKHRFYNGGGGDTQPEVVQPVIKSKRSVDNNQLDQRMAVRKLRTLQQQQQQLHDGIRELGTEEDGDGGPASTSLLSLQHSSSSSQLKPELSSSSSSSSSLLLNNDSIDNTPHNHHLQQQQQQQQQRQQKQLEYLSNYNRYRGAVGEENEEQGSSGSSSGSNSNLRDKIRSKKALLRRIRGASEECCERSCTYADMEAYCAAASSQAQAAAAA